MKSLPVIMIAVVLSGIVSAGVATLATGERGNDLDERDLMHDVAAAESRIVELQDRVEDLTLRLARRSEAESQLAALTIDRRELQDLKNEWAAWRARLTQRPGELVASKDDGEEVLDELIDTAVRKRMRTAQRKQLSQFKPFIKSAFTRGIRRASKRLNLNDFQNKRLEESMSKAFDEAAPNFLVLFDSTATPAEKDDAFAKVEESMDAAKDDAKSYLDAEQFEQFADMQDQTRDGMEQMRTLLTMPEIPGMPGTPAASDDPTQPVRIPTVEDLPVLPTGPKKKL